MAKAKGIYLSTEEYERQEAVLQFERFSDRDAWELGKMLVQFAEQNKYPVAIEITVNGHARFKYAFEGATTNNDAWMRRKRNAVIAFEKSSMHLGALLAAKGEDMEKDHRLSEADYAFHGGGFPIRIRGTGVIGTVCVSGLPQQEDHRMVVDVLCAFLGVSL